MGSAVGESRIGNTKSFQEICDNALAQFPEGKPGSRECRTVMQSWIATLQAKHGRDSYRFESAVNWAAHVLWRLQEALAIRDGKATDRLWVWPDRERARFPLDIITHDSDKVANSDRLDAALAGYLARAEVQSDLVDASAINAMLYGALVSHARDMRSGLAVNEINWAWALGGDNLWSQSVLRIAGVSIAFLALWVLPLALGVFFFASGLNIAGALVLGVWCLFWAWRLVRLPERWREHRKRKALHDRNERILQGLSAAWFSASFQTIHPQRLKDRVIDTEQLGFVYPPALHTLIDRAIQRDPTALIAR